MASFEGNFPNRIKQLPLDRHFDINNVKRVWKSFFSLLNSFISYCSMMKHGLWYQIVLEADGYQPYLISPEKGLRSLIKIVLELAKEPSRLCVDEVLLRICVIYLHVYTCVCTTFCLCLSLIIMFSAM